ncbi:RNA polymerase sigma factor [Telmatocola sphagniphila]|uniref:RNA polymerase sigma factor n=1 Tax=Telmatocola sphagniphila TaxID=1123043 RepID=UPI001FE86B67|nr:sigma-70 family RNA polymerase sigma factor [Telmatocola sphagniphila]
MVRLSDTPTPVSLLGQLHRAPSDPQAWERFVNHYGPKIHAWCRSWNLQYADAQDITQIVLLKVAAQLKEFEYDPQRSFRSWLKTVTFHSWRDQARKENRAASPRSEEALVFLEATEAKQSLARTLEEAFDEELLGLASARVRLRVAPKTWEAFRLSSLEQLPGAVVAERLGMKVAMVYIARSRVLKLLRSELIQLDPSLGENENPDS